MESLLEIGCFFWGGTGGDPFLGSFERFVLLRLSKILAVIFCESSDGQLFPISSLPLRGSTITGQLARPESRAFLR